MTNIQRSETQAFNNGICFILKVLLYNFIEFNRLVNLVISDIYKSQFVWHHVLFWWNIRHRLAGEVK